MHWTDKINLNEALDLAVALGVDTCQFYNARALISHVASLLIKARRDPWFADSEVYDQGWAFLNKCHQAIKEQNLTPDLACLGTDQESQAQAGGRIL